MYGTEMRNIMVLKKLSQQSKRLLDEILKADNPADMLAKRFDGLSAKEDDELRAGIRELREQGYINVQWADNVPYHVTINNSARTYDEWLQEYALKNDAHIVVDQSIQIGNGNSFRDTTIATHVQKTDSSQKTFWEKHPLLVDIIVAAIAGVILMFSFWDKLVVFIDGVF